MGGPSRLGGVSAHLGTRRRGGELLDEVRPAARSIAKMRRMGEFLTVAEIAAALKGQRADNGSTVASSRRCGALTEILRTAAAEDPHDMASALRELAAAAEALAASPRTSRGTGGWSHDRATARR